MNKLRLESGAIAYTFDGVAAETATIPKKKGKAKERKSTKRKKQEEVEISSEEGEEGSQELSRKKKIRRVEEPPEKPLKTSLEYKVYDKQVKTNVYLENLCLKPENFPAKKEVIHTTFLGLPVAELDGEEVTTASKMVYFIVT